MSLLDSFSADSVRRRRRGYRPILLGCVLLLVGALAAFSQRCRLVLVVGDSMLPTFRNGMILAVDRRAYVEREPARGDLVVARRRDEYLVKRIVGLPGETVELRGGRLYVNEERKAEEYEITSGALEVGKGLLAPGRFALLGDNRALGGGQIAHAVVAREDLMGRVAGVVVSW